MNFKEAMEDDIKNVFLDIETFGEPHTVNGKEITVCIQDGLFRERDGRFTENRRTGLFENSCTMYVSAQDFGKPKAETSLDIDGKQYRVLAALDEGGIRRIELERTDAR